MAKKPPSDITRGQGHDDVATLLQGWMDKVNGRYGAMKHCRSNFDIVYCILSSNNIIYSYLFSNVKL